MIKKLSILLIALPSIASAQTFGERIWWQKSHNQFSAEVNRAVGTPHAGIPYLGPNAYRNGAVLPPSTSGGQPSFRMRGNLPISNGPIIDVDAKFKPASFGPAIGRFASKILYPLSVGMAVYDLANELGFTVENTPTGPLLKRPALNPCLSLSPPPPSSPPSYAQNPDIQSTYTSFLDTDGYCLFGYAHKSEAHGWPGPSQRPGGGIDGYVFEADIAIPGPSSPTFETVSWSELADIIAAESGWPTSSSIDDAIHDALESGETIETETPTVSGPATSQPTTTTTTNTSNNTTTNTTNQNNYNYNNNTVTVNQITNTTVINNDTGQPISSETTTTDTPPDLPPPEQKQLCELFPDILACKKLDPPTDSPLPRVNRDISLQSGPTFGGGSCPPDVVVNVAGRSITLLATAQPCAWIETFMRPIILLLASISAAFIVLPRAD